jgi:MFS family permease
MEISAKLKSNIWKIYLYEALYSLMFYTPIIVLFYHENGLSLSQIMIIQSFSAIAWILLEIPSGYFADMAGRKISLMFNGIFAFLAMLTLGLGSNFYHFLLAALFWALAGVFISGADSALMYDTLKELKREKSYKKAWGNVSFCSFTGISIASVLGGLLGKIDLRYPFLIALPFYIILIPLSLSLYEPKEHKKISTENQAFDLLKSIRKTVFQNKNIRQIFIISAVLSGTIGITYFLYQPYFELSKIRATVCSVQSVLNSCLQAIIAPIIGWLADFYSLPQALTIIGIVILSFGIVVTFLLYQKRLGT